MNKFLLRLRNANTQEELTKLKEVPPSELQQYPNSLFKQLILPNKNPKEVYDSLRELYQIQTLPSHQVSLVSNSIELFCLKTLVDPQITSNRIKLLCLLIIKNQSAKSKLPSSLDQFFNSASWEFYDKESNLVFLFDLFNSFGLRSHFLKQLKMVISTSSDTVAGIQQMQQQIQQQQNFILTSEHTRQFNTGAALLHLLRDAVHEHPTLFTPSFKLSISNYTPPSHSEDAFSMDGIEKMFKTLLLEAGSFSERKKKSVFGGSNVLATELDGSQSTGFFTVLNHAQVYSHTQTLNMIIFSTLSSVMACYEEQKQQITKQFQSSIEQAAIEASPGSGSGNVHMEAISKMFSGNTLLDAITSYCLRLLQQAEAIFSIKDPSKMLFSYTFVEASVIEAIKLLDRICLLCPYQVPKIFVPLKKFFQLFCDTNMSLYSIQQQASQQVLSTTGSLSSIPTVPSMNFSVSSAPSSPYARRTSISANISSPSSNVSKAPSSPSPATSAPNAGASAATNLKLLQQELTQFRSHTGCVFIHLFNFFLHHKHSLVYEPNPLFQKFFLEQFPLCHQDPIFPIEMMISLLQNRSLIQRETKIFDEFYPQLFKMFSYMPHSIFSEMSTLLPALISRNSFIDIFHRIIDLPLLCFCIDYQTGRNGEIYIGKNQQQYISYLRQLQQAQQTPANAAKFAKKQAIFKQMFTNNIQINNFVGQLFDAILKDEVRSEQGFWHTVDPYQQPPFLQQIQLQSPYQGKQQQQKNMQTQQDWKDFCASIKTVSKRVTNIAKWIPKLLDIYFDVILNHLDNQQLVLQVVTELVPTIFRRLSFLFPMNNEQSGFYYDTVKSFLLNKLLQIFKIWPNFVIELKPLLIQTLQEQTIDEDVFSNVCYLLGDCISHLQSYSASNSMVSVLNTQSSVSSSSSVSMDQQKTPEQTEQPQQPMMNSSISNSSNKDSLTDHVSEYFDMLELVTYEKIAKTKMRFKMRNMVQQQRFDIDRMSDSEIEERAGYTDDEDYENSGSSGAASNPSAVTDDEQGKHSSLIASTAQTFNMLISTMTKMAAKCPDLAPRAIVCLANIIKNSQVLHPYSLQRANESVRLLKYPSIAAAILSSSAPPKTEETSEPSSKVTHISSKKGSSNLYQSSLHPNEKFNKPQVIDSKSSLLFISEPKYSEPKSFHLPSVNRVHPFTLLSTSISNSNTPNKRTSA